MQKDSIFILYKQACYKTSMKVINDGKSMVNYTQILFCILYSGMSKKNKINIFILLYSDIGIQLQRAAIVDCITKEYG